MEYLELFSDLLPMLLSILATIAAFKKGKKTLTAEEIEAKAEATKQKIVNKLNKKNNIPSKVETVVTETTENTNQGITTLV